MNLILILFISFGWFVAGLLTSRWLFRREATKMRKARAKLTSPVVCTRCGTRRVPSPTYTYGDTVVCRNIGHDWRCDTTDTTVH